MYYNVIIAGSRNCPEDKKLVNEAMSQLAIPEGFKPYIISGGARGADRAGEMWARSNKHPLRVIPAQWGKHGKMAGYMRNRDMVEIADALVALWDGTSKGTWHTIELAKHKGIPVVIYSVKGV